MNAQDFERILDVVAEQLGQEVRASKEHHAPDAFQRSVYNSSEISAKVRLCRRDGEILVARRMACVRDVELPRRAKLRNSQRGSRSGQGT